MYRNIFLYLAIVFLGSFFAEAAGLEAIIGAFFPGLLSIGLFPTAHR